MQWTKSKIAKCRNSIRKTIQFLRIKYPNLIKVPKTSFCYREFNSKFSNLLSAPEFSYWYKNKNILFNESTLFCRVCGSRVTYDKTYCYFPKHCSCKCSQLDVCTSKKRATTCKNKYGVSNVSKLLDVKTKKLETRKTNGTFNTSLQEEHIYKLLCKSFGKRQVRRQYHSDLYPFSCDFYLPKFDLYIEYNGSWTHGDGICHEPFNPRKKSHRLMVYKWNKLCKKCPYYREALQTWTIRDPLKRKIAKKNNLRHIEFWHLDQIVHWTNTYCHYKRFSRSMLYAVD